MRPCGLRPPGPERARGHAPGDRRARADEETNRSRLGNAVYRSRARRKRGDRSCSAGSQTERGRRDLTNETDCGWARTSARKRSISAVKASTSIAKPRRSAPLLRASSAARQRGSPLRAARSTPLVVKLPPFRTDVEREVVLSLARIALEEGADGLTCSNTLPVTEPGLASGAGGLSGRELLAGTIENVRALRDATQGSVPIVACGGVSTATDALACLEAGATAVQLYTGLVYRGPRIVGELTAGLARVARGRPGGLASMTKGHVLPGEDGLLAD